MKALRNQSQLRLSDCMLHHRVPWGQVASLPFHSLGHLSKGGRLLWANLWSWLCPEKSLFDLTTQLSAQPNISEVATSTLGPTSLCWLLPFSLLRAPPYPTNLLHSETYWRTTRPTASCLCREESIKTETPWPNLLKYEIRNHSKRLNCIELLILRLSKAGFLIWSTFKGV